MPNPPEPSALAAEGRRVFGPANAPAATEQNRPTRPGQRAQAAEPGGWSIVVAAFRGDDMRQSAETMLRRVRTEGNLPEAYLDERGPALAIAVGRYVDPAAPEAQRELERVQSMEIDGLRPYAFSYLAPPVRGTELGGRPEYNLLRAKQTYGRSALYTLQIGVYGREDLPRPTETDLAEARRLAEEAAARLRSEGELAFYYHGPHRSMVTVGVFDSTDIDPQGGRTDSPRLRDARQRHPHNLYNGAGIRERVPGAPARLQPSRLVAIPGK